MANPLAERFKEKLKKAELDIFKALPAHVNKERFVRMALNVFTQPGLMECSDNSKLMAIMRAAQTGLEADPNLGQCYFVPRRNKGSKEVQFLVGYKGLCALAYRSDKVLAITCEVVCQDDEFEFEYGSTPVFRHKPKATDRTKDFKAVWADAQLIGGGFARTMMFIEEVWKVRDKHSDGFNNERARQYNPWVTSTKDMIRKTCVKKLCKLLPVSTEMQRAISFDEEADIPRKRESTPEKLEDAIMKQSEEAKEIEAEVEPADSLKPPADVEEMFR